MTDIESQARKNTNKLLDYIEEVCGREPTDVEIALVKWMNDDEVGECARANEFILEDEEDETDCRGCLLYMTNCDECFNCANCSC